MLPDRERRRCPPTPTRPMITQIIHTTTGGAKCGRRRRSATHAGHGDHERLRGREDPDGGDIEKQEECRTGHEPAASAEPVHSGRPHEEHLKPGSNARKHQEDREHPPDPLLDGPPPDGPGNARKEAAPRVREQPESDRSVRIPYAVTLQWPISACWPMMVDGSPPGIQEFALLCEEASG